MWPEDGLDVSDEISAEYTGQPPVGRMLGVGHNLLPAWIDIPPPTQDELTAQAKAEKERRIAEANSFINSKQWPGKAAIGRLKGDDFAQYNLWLDYLDELNAVNTSTVPDIQWPKLSTT